MNRGLDNNLWTPEVTQHGGHMIMENVKKSSKIKYLNIDSRFQEEYNSLNNIFVTLWGSQLIIQESATCVLITEVFINNYPQLLPERLRPPPVNAPNARPRGRPRRIQP